MFLCGNFQYGHWVQIGSIPGKKVCFTTYFQSHYLMQEIGEDIRREQSPKQLLLVRGKLYELLVNCIPPEIIVRQLTKALTQRLDDELRHHVVKHAALFEHRLQQGSKAIFHLEAFVARFMAEYKNFLISALA